MLSEVINHLTHKILNAPVAQNPYPHFHTTDIFPAAFYDEMLRNMPDDEAYRSIIEGGQVNVGPELAAIYEKRGVVELFTTLPPDPGEHIGVIEESKRGFWAELNKTLATREFVSPLIMAFKPWFVERHGDGVNINFGMQIDLIRDAEAWSLGPHTDQFENIAVILFYLPTDDSKPHLGTSVYAPKEPGFTCPGGPHHSREGFDLIYTAPYVRNSAFAFFKSDKSFHGVEPMNKPGEVKYSIQLSVIRAV
jgi:hypothetical protein